MKRALRAPSPALVVSLIALFVALGGTTYAATSLPRNSVGPKQLKKNAVTSPKIKKGAVTAAKINTSGLTVPNALHATSADSATTAANASALGGVSASNYLRNSGNIYVQLGQANWEPLDSFDPVSIVRSTDGTQMDPSSPGTFYFRIDGVMPISLYGNALALAGIQICYGTTAPTSITEVALETFDQTTGVPAAGVEIADDKTVRNDSACRTFSPSSPVKLASDTQISIVLKTQWTTGGGLDLGRATAILQPTSAIASTPKVIARGKKMLGAVAPSTR
jgi:hypothetical protein